MESTSGCYSYGILGTTELRNGHGIQKAVPRPMSRALLAALLLDRGRIIPAGRLIDTLWGEAPPPSAQANLRFHIMQLRRLLPHRNALRTQAPGYTLMADHTDIDAELFESSIQRGQHAMMHGRLDEAEAVLSAGLALWRGHALMDVPDSPVFQPHRERLGELHLVATEMLMETRLLAGQGPTLIAELTYLVDLHPLRERLRAQLMVALQRGGRPSEATRVFHSYRTALGRDCGLSPRIPLHDLHEAIVLDMNQQVMDHYRVLTWQPSPHLS